MVWDPAAKKYDRSDAEWCFVIEHISRAQHIRRYGRNSIVSQLDFVREDNPAPGWIGVGKSGKLIQIAQYWRKEFKPRTLALMSNGDERWKDELDDQELISVIDEREEQDVTVKIYVINGVEILEETESIIPEICVVPYWGEIEVVNEVRRTYSLIRNSKDPQRLLNLEVSNLAEELGKMPKSAWRAVAGSIPEHLMEGWDVSGANPKAVAFYIGRNPEDTTEIFPPPTRETSEPAIQAIVVAINQCIDAIKAGMGIFDSSLGSAKAEYSGISVEKRTQQADITNYHFSANGEFSLKREGEILVQLIKAVDRPGSNVPIRAEDGRTAVVPIGVARIAIKDR